jgi:sugar lactone lactonase YvrE
VERIRESQATVLASGLVFGESPRWHDSKLWCTDIFGGQVYTCSLTGELELLLDLSGGGPGRRFPSGLGFLPDGTPVLGVLDSGQLFRLTPDGLAPHADLRDLIADGASTGDLVIDDQGRAFVGIVGPEGTSTSRRAPVPGQSIILVEPDGKACVLGPMSNNGIALSPDKRQLFTAAGSQLLTVDLRADGSFRGRPRPWADLSLESNVTRALRRGELVDPVDRDAWSAIVKSVLIADGICLDADGAVWAGSVFAGAFLRIERGTDLVGGVVTDRIATAPEGALGPEGKMATACVLGGPDGRTLFMATATSNSRAKRSSGFIETATVTVPAAGWP